MIRALFFIVPFLLFACFTGPEETFDQMVKRMTKGTVSFIKSKELSPKINSNDLLLLDTRQKKEFNVSHIKGAKWVGEDSWNDSLYKTAKRYKLVVCYCSVGYRSEKAGEWLMKNKTKNVRNLYGGIFAWKNAGYTVVDNQGKPTEKIHGYSLKWGKWVKKGKVVYE
ncbi:MAG: rhodanese-like domain-containing protein [Flavobacteriales bacterium]